MRALRRVSQGVFLALFTWLVLETGFSESPPQLLELFFDLDPLISLSTWLSARSLAAGSLLALLTLAATALLGRVFCGWICPLGTVHHIASRLRPKKRGRADAEGFSRWQRAKYFLLAALLVMSLFGGHWVGVFDPLSIMCRSLTTLAFPAAQYLVADGANAVYDADPRLGPLRLTLLTEPAYRFARDDVFRVNRQTFAGGLPVLAFFVLIVALNFVRPRFWCRYVCPLGGLLGLFSRRPALRLKNDKDACRNCGRCAKTCPAAAQPHEPGKWLPSECFVCWNCAAECRSDAVAFALESPLTPPAAGRVDLSRRATMAAGVGGVAALAGFRIAPETRGEQPFPSTLLRPPGARAEREFLQRCIQCGACMRVCPTNALHPSALEAGLEGLWTPRMVAKIGYCRQECTLCGQVCPTGAIEHLPLEEKKKVKVGLAAFDVSRCLPYAYGRECIVCEEHCPLSPKAIYVVPVEVTLRDGSKRVIKQPRVDADLCTGCGICEWSCLFQDQAAIRIYSANESRNAKNQPILPGPGIPPAAPPAEAAPPPAGPYGGGETTGAGNASPY